MDKHLNYSLKHINELHNLYNNNSTKQQLTKLFSRYSKETVFQQVKRLSLPIMQQIITDGLPPETFLALQVQEVDLFTAKHVGGGQTITKPFHVLTIVKR